MLKVRVGYRGYINMENVGDDLLYLTNRKLFEKEGVNLTPFRECPGGCISRVAFFGGGTILPLWISREGGRWGVSSQTKLIFFGVGVRDPGFFNTAPLDIRNSGIYPNLERTVCKNSVLTHVFNAYLNEIPSQTGLCAPKIGEDDFDKLSEYDVLFMGVRGPRSREFLRKHGIESELIGDPVLALGRISGITQEEEDLLILNIGGDGKAYPGYTRAMIKILREGTVISEETGLKPCFVPFSYTDLRKAILLKKFSKKTLCIIKPKRRFSSEEYLTRVLETYQRAGLVIGMKLHSLILAASMEIPFIGIAYRPKILDFALSLGYDVPVALPGDVSGERTLLNLFGETDIGKLKTRLRMSSKEYTKRLMRSAKRVSNMLSELS